MGAGILECDVTFTKNKQRAGGRFVLNPAEDVAEVERLWEGIARRTPAALSYYQTIEQAIAREGDLYKVLDVLAPLPSTPTAWASSSSATAPGHGV